MTNEDAIEETRELSLEGVLEYDGQKMGYAVGKWTLEDIGKAHSRQGRNVMILRPFNVVGLGQSSTYGMVVPNFINNSLEDKPITVYNDGEQTRSFSCVETVVSTLYKLIQVPAAWKNGYNIINIGSNHCVTVNHLAEAVLDITGSNSQIVHKPYTSAFPDKVDVKHRVPNLTRITNLVGEIEWPRIEEVITNMVKHSKLQSSTKLELVQDCLISQ